ncbi:MAG: hypothetical protein WEC75_03380 [Dehalococcoidia bacterium]
MATDAPLAAQPRQPSLHFPLQDGERVLIICRRHWLHLWPRLIMMALITIVPVTVVALIMSNSGAYEGTTAKVFWVISGVYILYWGIRILFTWYRYNNDVWVITNQRIIDSRKTTPFNLRMSTADLVNVQDMTIERDGVLRTMFDFGDVVCQTAAEQADFRLTGIPHPREVQALVDKERDRERMRAR